MKRGIIRALWGIYSDEKNALIQRRKKIDDDLKMLREKGIEHDYVCYTYGLENHKYLLECGVNSIMIDENPAPYDLKKEQYLHKIKSIEYAMFEDGYDEILHCDFDCIPEKSLDGIWDILNKKEPIQACLQLYRRRKCLWRVKDIRKVGNGGGLYIRGKNIIREIIACWEELRGPSAEPPISLYIDRLNNGWIGMEEWWKRYEIEIINLHRGSAFSKDKNKKKPEARFNHYI